MKDTVNIECDMIGKYIYKACETILSSYGADKQVSLDMLRRQGILKWEVKTDCRAMKNNLLENIRDYKNE